MDFLKWQGRLPNWIGSPLKMSRPCLGRMPERVWVVMCLGLVALVVGVLKFDAEFGFGGCFSWVDGFDGPCVAACGFFAEPGFELMAFDPLNVVIDK